MHLQDDEKVILFPKWKSALEKESLRALKEKKYEEALLKLDQLIRYGIKNHEIMTGKLICLMELGKWNEAQNLCEELLHDESDNYYNFVHIYLTILFQTSQYDLLMEQVKYEIQKKDLPEVQREQFVQLYDISEKMKLDITIEKEKAIYQQLFEAVEEKNYMEQWRQVQKLISLQAVPTNEVIQLLTNESVHPSAKTAILEWLQKSNWTEAVNITKFDVTLSILPNELEDIEENQDYVGIIQFLKEIENENPSLYYLIRQLLFHVTYVLYPINLPKEDYVYIANALEIIGRESLGILPNNQLDLTAEIEYYIEKINMMQSLNLSNIEG